MSINVVAAGSTMYPILFAIRSKGYKVTAAIIDEDESRWHASKDGNTFHAQCPEELLAIIAMWEVRGDDWLTWSEEEQRMHKENTVFEDITDENPK